MPHFQVSIILSRLGRVTLWVTHFFSTIFISAFSMYRYDASYAVEVQRAHPGRFAIVKPVDPDDPAVGDVIADWKQTPGAVGIRIRMTKEAKLDPNDLGLDRILREYPLG